MEIVFKITYIILALLIFLIIIRLLNISANFKGNWLLEKIQDVFVRKYPQGLEKIATQENYLKRFEIQEKKNKKGSSDFWKELIDKAWEIRNFEIELYWKRANYFWLFQAAAFTAYLAVTSRNVNGVDFNKETYIIICLGILLSVAWLLTNKGSKGWQRHWEEHIDLLEDKYYGPLYKTVGTDRTYSVSKINEIVSFCFVMAWVVIAAMFLHEYKLAFEWKKIDHYVTISTILTSLAICSMLWGRGRGYFKNRDITMYSRNVNYN